MCKRFFHKLYYGPIKPDSRYVLFVKRTSGQSELWRIPAEGGRPQKLLEMKGLMDISVHPDGRRIPLTRPESGGDGEVWVMENFLPETTNGE